MNYTVSNSSTILEELMNGTSILHLDNMTSSVIFDIDDELGLEGIRTFLNVMREISSKIPSLQDVQFFSPKLFMLEESKLFNAYFLIGATSKDKIDTAYFEIETYYYLNGLPWNSRWNERATDIEDQVGGILELIINMFFGVLSFALIASLMGLAISTVISVRKRYAEIGTLRTLGFSNGQIMRMIVGEGLITALIGIILGTIVGLLIAFLIVSNLPFMIFLPIIFAPPYELIGIGIAGLILASIAVSTLPAISAVKIDIAESIRSKGE
jgi:ABC-type antimicrobial peptide transport system permease subunit